MGASPVGGRARPSSAIARRPTPRLAASPSRRAASRSRSSEKLGSPFSFAGGFAGFGCSSSFFCSRSWAILSNCGGCGFGFSTSFGGSCVFDDLRRLRLLGRLRNLGVELRRLGLLRLDGLLRLRLRLGLHGVRRACRRQGRRARRVRNFGRARGRRRHVRLIRALRRLDLLDLGDLVDAQASASAGPPSRSARPSSWR